MNLDDFLIQTWEECYSHSLSLYQMIRVSGFTPELIIGVARGGWVPARLLADFFRTKSTANVKVEFYDDIGKTEEEPKVTQFPLEIKETKILLVDDVADTGKSLKVVLDRLNSLSSSFQIKVATIYYKPHSIVKPDYFLVETTKWVVFGWEKFEFMDQYYRMIMKDGGSLNLFKTNLMKLGIPPGEIEIFLNEMKN